MPMQSMEVEVRPTLRMAFQHGREAFKAGETLDRNPHRKQSPCYVAWHNGYVTEMHKREQS